MTKNIIKDWNELPLVLNIDNIREILQGDSEVKPSKDTVSDMMHSINFPLIKGTKELKVSRDAFRNWLMNL